MTQNNSRQKTAIILFNLGGPDGPDAVEPFLFNLFNDKAIIGVMQPLRWLLAKLISRRRAPVAKEIYAHLGGKSPLLENTDAQAAALEKTLNGGGEDCGDGPFRVFIAMRYWHPFSDETAVKVRDFEPDKIILLPLYPHFSTTTTGSSIVDWHRAAKSAGLNVPTSAICCYPVEAGLAQAMAGQIKPGLERALKETGAPPRLLFSAHGLPQKIVDKGDPYPGQIEANAACVAAVLETDFPGLDWTVCYQSRVGPLEWIGPSLDDEIERAGHEGKALVVFPIAFVSEHSETLVELDIEYAKIAEAKGVPAYIRVPTLGDDQIFIDLLTRLVKNITPDGGSVIPATRERFCPASAVSCPLAF